MENYKEIIELLKSNNPAGAEKLFELYGNSFYGYCLQKWLFSEDEAWEVVYKTLETLVLKLVDYRINSHEDFERFIYKVLINFLRQEYRSKKFKEAKQTVYVDFNAEGTPNEFSRYLNDHSLYTYYNTETEEHPALKRLNEVLESFEPIDRDLLLLRAQNYSYDEIADFLKIENNQLKVKHHRAKKKLVEQLNQTSNSLSHGKK